MIATLLAALTKPNQMKHTITRILTGILIVAAISWMFYLPTVWNSDRLYLHNKPTPAYDYLTGKRSPDGEWYYGTGRVKTSELPTIAQGNRSNQNSMNDVVQFIQHLGFNLGIEYTIGCISIAVVSGYLLGRNRRKK